jgi:hypothetical protein
MSKPASVCSTECGTTTTVRTKETAASTTGSAKTHGQVALSMIAAESEQPDDAAGAGESCPGADRLGLLAAGKLVVMTDSVTGMTIAAATPASDAKRDEHRRVGRERGCEVCGCERDEADEEDRLAAPAVTDGADGHEQRGEARV